MSAVPPATNRMSDVEALMWTLEKDPYLSSTFANLTIFDQPIDVSRLRRRLERATHVVARLRQRVAPAFGRMAPPVWEDDPDFDIDHHVRLVALPGAGTERDLLDLAAVLASGPFDRTRPLWEFFVIEGLEGDRSAMVQKMHHTITDGEGGVRMSIEFLDLERHPPDLPPVAELPRPAARHSSASRSVISTALDTFGHNIRRQVAINRRGAEITVDALRHPSRLVGFPAELTATVASLGRQVAVSGERRSPLWTERSLRRQFEVFKVSFDDAHGAAHKLGGSINDFFVAGAAGGAGAYHRALGVDVEELRISMPVSTRTDRSAAGNAFSVMRPLVPTGADPVARFEAIHERLSATKQERTVALTSTLAGVANILPTSVLVRVARQQVETVDFATSNVRAAPFDLYIAGGRMEANYPMGPVAGTAFNLTTMSYCGALNMGLHIDPVAIADPTLLAGCMKDAYAELIDASR